MDWNLNTPTEWDWENLAIYTTSTKDMENVVPKTLQFSTQENVDNVVDNIVDFSFSASVDSASKETIKTFGVFDDLPKDFLEKEDQSCSWVKAGEEVASSVLSGEAMIGLKLGRHAESNNSSNKSASSSVPLFPNTSSPMIKRSRASYLSSQSSPRCQVEGCNLDLASAKDYHRRHRICANHSKSPKVVVAGMERRFCQQCSRFHDLSEFDDRKRSCRRRLSAHNARRRRPQSEEIQFGSTGMMSSSSICDRRPAAQMSFLLNRSGGGSIPILDSAAPESFKGNESSCTLIGLSKAGDHLMPTTNAALNFSNSERFIPRINNANHNAGMDNSILSGDVRHAFSLLSTTTSSWSSSNWPAAADQESFDHQFGSHGISLAQPGMPLDNTTTHLQDFHHSIRSSHEFERFYSN